MNEKIHLKRKISEAATARFVKNRYFTINSLAKQLKLSEADIYEHFQSRSSMLYYYYESRVHIYAEQTKAIDGYKSFTLSEKLGNFFLTLLDLFDEHREFVLNTYPEFIINKRRNSLFKELFLAELESIFSTDEKISATTKTLLKKYSFDAVYLQFHCLIKFWSRDKSRNREDSMALVDKWCTLAEEICYSKTAEKGFDLLKFLVYHSPFKKIINKYNISNNPDA